MSYSPESLEWYLTKKANVSDCYEEMEGSTLWGVF